MTCAYSAHLWLCVQSLAFANLHFWTCVKRIVCTRLIGMDVVPMQIAWLMLLNWNRQEIQALFQTASYFRSFQFLEIVNKRHVGSGECCHLLVGLKMWGGFPVGNFRNVRQKDLFVHGKIMELRTTPGHLLNSKVLMLPGKCQLCLKCLQDLLRIASKCKTFTRLLALTHSRCCLSSNGNCSTPEAALLNVDYCEERVPFPCPSVAPVWGALSLLNQRSCLHGELPSLWTSGNMRPFFRAAL